jgi:hypothetical protein
MIYARWVGPTKFDEFNNSIAAKDDPIQVFAQEREDSYDTDKGQQYICLGNRSVAHFWANETDLKFCYTII